ncbi:MULTISPECIES: S-methyl-5'-thioinosine phosphorylase [unclassified Methylophilus]|jgi:5'-methylthioinosine phosphorylase|uniref:Probable 6-oxopurine nucleoside phosphorylase n=1 Tax=Methylophilus glucosoxydans TaxID=752553 RepID=A0ABW3GMJ5_9PROT|nr:MULTISPECIES: S-methyl-5'-thioinosine phosphorylase [unclassified Methylophilus]MBF5038999.1 S-methyl-5'-thioinosine phosphorylase [Methylophilus sp. 13]MDF0377163.1 S-methyl-5'-thioinosine phosphorylase [Methylophilus sp. YYY-1]BEV08436.1 S-methyl-5'-thioinosine phosphorylase [Methylophilus sp. DW102]
MLGIIGGTGLTALDNLNISKRLIVRTPYGEPSQPLVFGEINGKEVVFLARHGGGHTIPPHAINYRANVWALHSVGVCDLLAVATVGGITRNLIPGDIVLPNQILDYTYGRNNTYHDGIELPVRHVDFTQPYSQAMRERCLKAAADVGCSVVDGGVYACVQGPRLETAAEIDRYERDGATLVGMTGMPEAVLARELGVSYAAICPVANFAAGRGDSTQSIQFEQVMPLLQQTMDKVRAVIAQYLSDNDCSVA